MADGFLLGPNLLSRVRRVVDAAEGDIIGSGVRSIPVALEGDSQAPRVFRICTFTGSWAINATRIVNLKYVPGATNTLSATNLFANITGSTATSTIKNCAVAKEGTAWFLIAAEC
jgi:hypothetical protein